MQAHDGLQSTTPIDSETRVHVAFDRTSGEVLHVHESIVFPNGAQPHETPEARARRFAGATGSDNIEIVEVDPAELRVPGRIRIDPTTHKVHRLPNEPRR